MKQKFYSLLLLFTFAWATNTLADEQQAQWCMVVESAGGETIAIGADLKPIIATTAEGYELQYGDVITSFAWNELKKVTMEETVADANLTPVESVEGPIEETRFQVAPGVVHIEGAEPGSMAQIFSMDGRQVNSARVGENGSVSLSTSGLPKNLYIIKTNKTTFKMIKK